MAYLIGMLQKGNFSQHYFWTCPAVLLKICVLVFFHIIAGDQKGSISIQRFLLSFFHGRQGNSYLSAAPRLCLRERIQKKSKCVWKPLDRHGTFLSTMAIYSLVNGRGYYIIIGQGNIGYRNLFRRAKYYPTKRSRVG